jgi:hypothetical protein
MLLDKIKKTKNRLRAYPTHQAVQTSGSTALSDLPFVTSVGGCRLILKVGSKDEGTIHVSNAVFECILTRATWENAEGLVEPFCEGNLSGYQWLYDLDTDIEFLFSPSGDW